MTALTLDQKFEKVRAAINEFHRWQPKCNSLNARLMNIALIALHAIETTDCPQTDNILGDIESKLIELRKQIEQ